MGQSVIWLVLTLIVFLVQSVGTTMSGVTYNSVAMTFIGSNDGGAGYLEMWALATGDSSGSHDVVFTVNGGNGFHIAVGCASFSGVSQSAPLGTLLTSTNYVSSGVNVTVPVNGLGFDVASDLGSAVTPVVPQVPGASQVKRFEDWIEVGVTSAIFSSTRTTSGLFNWTECTAGGDCPYQTQLGIPINPFIVPSVPRRRGILVQ